MAEKNARYLEVMKSFGKAVRFYRNKLGFSQEALADRAQLDRSYMSQIERGIKNATLNSIWRIAAALDAKPSDLLHLTEELAVAGEKAPALLDKKIAAHKSAVSGAKGPTTNPILVVDDDIDICATVDSILREAGFATLLANSGFDAFRLVSREPVRAVVSDIRMPNGNGLELLGAMKKHSPDIPVIIMTGYDDLTIEDARRLGASGLVIKPFESERLVGVVRDLVEAAVPVG